MHMVVALLIWAAWVTKQETGSLKPEIRQQHPGFKIRDPAGFAYCETAGFLFCINRTPLFTAGVKAIRKYPNTIIFITQRQPERIEGWGVPYFSL